MLPTAFNPHYWEDYLVQNLFESHEFQNQLFRFVDVYPVLPNSSEIADHFRAYLQKLELSPAMEDVLKLSTTSLTEGLSARLIRFSIEKMARKYILGDSLLSNQKAIKELNKKGYGLSFDVLGEATLTEKEGHAYAKTYLDMIEQASVLKLKGQVNLSLKCTALLPHLSLTDHETSVDQLTRVLLPILTLAHEKGVFINIDMEQCDYHNIIYDAFSRCMLSEPLGKASGFGIVVQAYTLDSEERCRSLLSLAQTRGQKFAIRLVKGAYWDYEVAMARQRGWEIPVFTQKSDSDRQYEKLTTLLLEHSESFYPAFATHNLRSMLHACLESERMNLETSDYEFQMLYGMAPAFGEFILSKGYQCRLYCPLGEMIPGMGYLVRRLLENSSNTGFLKKFHSGVDLKSLLFHDEDPPQAKDDSHTYDKSALLNFSKADIRRCFEVELGKWKNKFPLSIDLGKEFSNAEQTKEVISPNDGSQLGQVEFLNIDHLTVQIDLAHKAFPEWKGTAIKKRVKMIEKCAELMELKRYELATLMCYEVGKSWSEADADVVEAIDFCRFYASRAECELGAQEVISLPGEKNILSLSGRGVTAVISPWNFPLAILCGMSSAALLAGNTVLLKPAEQSVLIAWEYYQLLLKAGVPDNVVKWCPCDGEKVFSKVCHDSRIRQIVFTGSKEVGLQLLQKSVELQPGQVHLQQVFAEMGGKNSAYVDDDADFDEVIPNVLYSAFAFAGQKCSALSRLFVHKNIKSALISRLLESLESLKLGSACEASCDIGPLIDEQSYQRVLQLISESEKDPDLKLLYKGTNIPEKGYFIPPLIYEANTIEHKFLQEEFFAPILTVMEVDNFQAGLDAINHSSFGLTASVYSRHPERLKKAREQCEVGNLYLNRGCTGAIVGRQPFGGLKLSGTGIKAGGIGYLKQFAEAKTVTENTCRHGFVSHDS